MAYEPQPRDTRAVELPAEIEALADALARNTHEVWARRRMNEGWSYGAHRDDALKTTPNLVPYDDLPDFEKAYDVATSMETLKTIVSMGFAIISPQTQSLAPRSKEEKARLELWEQRIDDIAPLSGERLALLWSSSDLPGLWNAEVASYRTLVKKLLGRDKPLVGIHVAISGLKRWPRDPALRHLLALGQARSGAARNAQDVLDALLEEPLDDTLRVEALACYGRTYKDLWRQTSDPRRQRDFLELAYHKYREAYEIDGTYFPAINTATLAHLRGDRALSRRLATQVLQTCEAMAKEQTLDYWLAATLGEAALLCEDLDGALHYYAQAANLGAGDYANLDSTRQQALTILEVMAVDEQVSRKIASLFAVPPVVLLQSHEFAAAATHLSPQLEAQLAQELKAHLDEVAAAFGYVSASSNADLLFIEQMNQRVGERTDQVHLVLPCSPNQFREHSLADDGTWHARFKRVCEGIAAPRFYGEPTTSSFHVAQHYSHLIAMGLAKLQARRLHTELIPVVLRVTDTPQTPPAPTDGTTRVITLNVPSPAAVADPPAAPSKPGTDGTDSAPQQQIKAILFADVVGYSKLTEAQIPLFVEHFLQPTADLLGSGPDAPGVRNTWGDALYLVFDELAHAGNAALKLRDQVRNTDWPKLGLPESLNVRIALHAGLVYPCYDPVIELDTFVGSHVSWAARIEPITPRGEVYASEPFAAIAAAQGIDDFACDYVGAVPLAKDYGEFVLYHVNRGT